MHEILPGRAGRTRRGWATRIAAVASAFVASALAMQAATAAPVTTGTVNLSNVQVYYREKGQGRPVVFVHPLLTDSRMWLDQLAGICEQRRCLAPDASGHGFSSPITFSKVDSGRYADELLEFLDAVGVREPVDLVGLSGGGNIAALACAGDHDGASDTSGAGGGGRFLGGEGGAVGHERLWFSC